MNKIVMLFLVFSIFISSTVFAELKSDAMTVQKLTAEETKDAPILTGSNVYPFFGLPCTNFTYSVTYKDEKGRAPSYIRIWLNGEWHDATKVSGDYTTGAKYTFNYVPTSGKSVFYYFEASNGAGKARAGIIDSPDQGPLLYEDKLDDNQIMLLDKSGNLLWAYDTKNDWVEGVAMSKDGNRIAAVTGYYIYLFSKDSNTPLWSFCQGCQVPPVTMASFNGVDISADGKFVAATLGNTLYYFSAESNVPVWEKQLESNVIGVAISENGSYVAVGMGNSNDAGDKIQFFDSYGTMLWEYKADHPGYVQTGNFYRPAMTPDANYVAISSGCPDRRAYLFSKDGSLLFRTEMLTTDSPVHKSAISENGNYIAYSADHMTGKDVLFLYSKSGQKLWSFGSSSDSTARAVSISEDGNYIGLGTLAGNIYMFSKFSNVPLWKFSETGTFAKIGDVKLSPDGKLLAAVGSTKKVYLFSKDSSIPLWEYSASTYVTFVDFNGEYVVAGTGAREYVFEGNSASTQEVTCTEIIQPPKQTGSSGLPSGTTSGSSVCGNSFCEPDFGETPLTCPDDCGPNAKKEDKLSDNLFNDSVENDSKPNEGAIINKYDYPPTDQSAQEFPTNIMAKSTPQSNQIPSTTQSGETKAQSGTTEKPLDLSIILLAVGVLAVIFILFSFLKRRK